MPPKVVTSTGVWRGVRYRIRNYPTFIEPYIRGLLLLACIAFFLHSAGTIDVVYTIRPSFALLAIAAILGLPIVCRGWALMPRWILFAAAALVAVYALSAVANTETTLGLARAGPQRVLVYLADLCVGLATFGLVVTLWRGQPPARGLLQALVFSGTLAGAYACYQWVAQRMGWPLADVLSVADSNALTTGGSQGAGVLGSERVRGTFLEPHFLGAFLAGALPLAVALRSAVASRRARWWIGPAMAFMVAALFFTASVPAWAVLLSGSAVILFPFFVLNGMRRAAGVTAAFLMIIVLALPAALAYPGLLSGITGRTAVELEMTSSFRTDTWQDALTIWSQRPVLGYGAGQSAVRLTAETVGPAAPGLLSPQGLWAAALVDVGVLGLGCWLILLGGLTFYGLLGFLRSPTAARAGIAAAALVVLASALMAGDRVELRTWVILGLLTNAALPIVRPRPPLAPSDASSPSERCPSDRSQGHKQADNGAAHGPSERSRINGST